MEKDNTLNNITVVLCNFNDSRFLIDVVEKIAAQSPDEFIVVDDRSNDRSIELLKCLQDKYDFKIVINDGVHSPFGSFVKGCQVATSKYIACFSADDYPERGYLWQMRDAIENYPMVDVYTCNTYVVREGEMYKRTLSPFTSYISPDYAVKIFQAGYAKDINQCGIVINREWVLKCWEGGGKDTDVCFDCMYSFLSIFDKGFVNLGKYLTVYRSYPTGFGATSSNRKIKAATKVHKKFAKERVFSNMYKRAKASGMWGVKARWKALIALWLIMKLPMWARRKFYNWFYQYSQKVEKL